MHQGVGITACIGHKDLSKFVDSLVEGRPYMIRKFQVSSHARKYSAVPNRHTIFFTPWTILEEIPTEQSTKLPLHIFNFVDFEDLDHRSKNGHGLTGTHSPCNLPSLLRLPFPDNQGMLCGCHGFVISIDVIGQLTVVHPVVCSSGLNGPTVRRLVELRDLRFVSYHLVSFPNQCPLIWYVVAVIGFCK